ncbi:MAG: glutamate--tRNA ligase [Lentisphaerota bacterium]
MIVRTRFAPSPTGNVHIGNIRAAIYNWLYARHSGGHFLLRIEDTDRERSTPQAVQTVLDSLEWLGLNYDETPVYQSTQLQTHLAAAEKLLASGHAYKEDKGGTGKGECIIFKMPGTDLSFHDEIKGDMKKAAKDLPDFVIVRSNGTPVFHLANVVDDIGMNITHVIRGDDHVENTFRHIALFSALGAPVPKYAHLPMIVNAQGKPYSKRDGDAYVGEFKEKGFLPEALFNYLVLLGWSPGDDREVLSREELTRLFDFDRVQSSPAQMDPRKLLWMNGEYMKALPQEERRRRCQEVMQARGLWNDTISAQYFEKVVEVMGERIKLFSDIADQAGYFFTDDYAYDEKSVQKRLKKEGAMAGLSAIRQAFTALSAFTVESTDQALHALAQQQGLNPGELVHPIRVAVSGTNAGPSLFHMLEVLGKDRVIARIDKTLSRFA